MSKWTARAILALIVVALFIPWDPMMIEMSNGGVRIPFGAFVLGALALGAAIVGAVVGLVWLLIAAGIIKDDRG